jgi:SAM-dependent methyltransferase
LKNQNEEASWQERYLDRFYLSRPNWINGTTEFHQMICKRLASHGEILELGPGPNNQTSDYLAKSFASLDGLDLDEEAKGNSALRKIYISAGEVWPIPDASYDAVVANYVLEHLQNPAATFAEVTRVLRQGGFFFFRTPNLFYYVSLVSRFSPLWFHRLVANRLRNLPAGYHDPYPTFYRANSCRKVRALASVLGLQVIDLFTIEKEPSYGMASRALFFPFMAYERLVNCSEIFSPFRANILGTLQKP